MEYSKPKVTIDLDEYNHLKEISKINNSTIEGISREDLAKIIGALVPSHNGNYTQFEIDNIDKSIKRIFNEFGVEVSVFHDNLTMSNKFYLNKVK